MNINLIGKDGILDEYVLKGTPIEISESVPVFNRVAYAAAHIVCDPLLEVAPTLNSAIDWDATMAFRRHLWKLGFKVAEAMDTSQRGMGINWETAAELIRRSILEAKNIDGADLSCGAGTDQLEAISQPSLDDVIAAYEMQFEHIEKYGGRSIMMASRALVRAAQSADDYKFVYNRLLSNAQDKVILHWLGDMFDSNLKGYWGSQNFDEALNTVVEIISENANKIEGIKISLLDAEKEIELRKRLPDGVLCFTGDDFNYTDLIEGDGTRHSHALLGIFDAIAPSASKALSALAKSDRATYHDTIEPTVALSRKIFEAPTQYYKSGVVFLAWLNGHQNHFTMAGGMQSARSSIHYCEIFRLADEANVFDQPDLAVSRMRALLSVAGIYQ